MVGLVFTAAYKFPFILLVTKPTLNFSITCQRNIGATSIYQCYLPFFYELPCRHPVIKTEQIY